MKTKKLLKVLKVYWLKEKDKRTNNDLQNTQKTKDLATIPQKSMNSGASEG